MAKGDIETYYEDGRWKNRPQGNERASSTHDTKAEAQAEGRRMAVDRQVEHVIKKQDAPSVRRTPTHAAGISTHPRADEPHTDKHHVG